MRFVTREELSELDRRIAVSVARGEAAIARQEAAVARQQEASAQIEAISARMGGRLERAEEDRGELKELIAEMRAERERQAAEMRADREVESRNRDVENRKLDAILAELREGRDERRAMVEGLMRVIDRLPPAKGQS